MVSARFHLSVMKSLTAHTVSVHGLGCGSVVGVQAQYVGDALLTLRTKKGGGWSRQDALNRPGFMKSN